MILGTGPVMRYELITTARRGRYDLARVIYGLALLFLLWTRFETMEIRPSGGREQDNWISLTTTLLTPREVVLAKQLGAVWTARRLGLAMAIAGVVGVLLGAIHPLSVLPAASVGVFASASARNATRALLMTLLSLLVLLVLLAPWPFALASTLFSPAEYAAAGTFGSRGGPILLALTPESTAILGTIIAADLGLAGVLTAWSIRRLRTNWGRM